MSNVGRWDRFYADIEHPVSYGPSKSYRIGARFLSQCDRVEDWGCGLGWLRKFIGPGSYVGVDGSWSRFADEVDDLETRRSQTSGLFMRHVLEHNYQWQRVLDNAVASFTDRMVLILFTPWADETTELRHEDDYDVPTLAFKRDDIEARLAGRWIYRVLDSPQTHYGVEHIYMMAR